MDLGIIIVSYKVKDRLENNLRALFNSPGDFKYDVWVVDNNSQDGTIEMVKEKFSQVNLIVNEKNLGFAKANNQAWKKIKAQGGAKYVLLLNPDMKVYLDTLKNMVDWLDANPQATVAGGHLVDENDKTVLSVRRFPYWSDELAVIFKLAHFFPRIIKKYLYLDFDYTVAQPVDSIRGSFFFIRSDSLGENIFDERYFIWYEEVDFCRNVKKQGGQVWYTPMAKCQDYVGQSFGKVKNLFWKQKVFRNSQLAYFYKWQPWWQGAILWLAWLPVLVILIPLELIRKILNSWKRV